MENIGTPRQVSLYVFCLNFNTQKMIITHTLSYIQATTQMSHPIHTHSVDSKKRKVPTSSNEKKSKKSKKASDSSSSGTSSKSSILKFFKKPLFKNVMSKSVEEKKEVISSVEKSLPVESSSKATIEEKENVLKMDADVVVVMENESKNEEKMDIVVMNNEEKTDIFVVENESKIEDKMDIVVMDKNDNSEEKIVSDILKDVVDKAVSKEFTTTTTTAAATTTPKSKKKKKEKVELPPPESKISFQEKNPKKTGSKSAARYDVYKTAKTLAEFYSLGGKKADARNDIRLGYLKILEIPVVVVAAAVEKKKKEKKITSFVKNKHNITKENLPEGWKTLVKERGGNGGAKGTYYEFVAPNGSKHRSIRSVLRHLGLLEEETTTTTTTTTVSKSKQELPPDPRLKEYEELLNTISKEVQKLVLDNNLREDPEMVKTMDMMWKSVREDKSSENPINILKPLISVMLLDRDTTSNDSTELAKIVFDEMKACESRFTSNSTSEHSDIINRITLDSIASSVPLLSEVKTYGSTDTTSTTTIRQISIVNMIPPGELKRKTQYLYRERTLLSSVLKAVQTLIRALRNHKDETTVIKKIEDLKRKRQYVDEHRMRETKRLEKIRLKKEREELRKKLKEDQRRIKEQAATKRLEEKKKRDELKEQLKKQKEAQKEALRLAREEKKQKEKEMRELEREKKKKEKIIKKRMGAKAITSFFSKSPASSKTNHVANTTDDIDGTLTTTKETKRRNLFSSFVPIAKRTGTKVPKGYMFFMSHEIPYNAEAARPARLRKRRSGDKTVTGRRPFSLHQSKDYDMDSDEEWAEQGESLSGDSEIDEPTQEEDDYQMDDWLCSDEEVEYVGSTGVDTETSPSSPQDTTTTKTNLVPRKWKPKKKKGSLFFFLFSLSLSLSLFLS